MPRLRPTFPPRDARSIISADLFHDLVRDGEGWYQVASITRTVSIIEHMRLFIKGYLELVDMA